MIEKLNILVNQRYISPNQILPIPDSKLLSKERVLTYINTTSHLLSPNLNI